MSRLHKKIPAGVKKKKSEGQSDVQSGVAVSKSATTASTLKAKPEKKMVDAVVTEPNFFQKGIEFFREVKVELKKVTWPTKKQTTGTTIVVIIFVFVVSAFLGLFDLSLSKLVQVVLT